MSREIYEASREDGPQILRIMEDDIAKGPIRLLYTRRENPIDSLQMESPDAKVCVVRKDNEVIATIAGIPRKMYINGQETKVSYITNFKKEHGSNAIILWYEVFKKLYGELSSDVFYCSVVKDNNEVLQMLHKKRKRMPYAQTLDSYKTYIINPCVRIKDPLKGGDFRKACKEDEEAVIEFLRTSGHHKNFFPAFDSLDEMHNLHIDNFYLLLQDGEILAVGALWDRTDCKQYIVVQYEWALQMLKKMNGVIPLLGYVKFPKENTVMKFPFLSFYLAKEDNPIYYRAFLSRLFRAIRAEHEIIVLGTNQKNPKYEILNSIRSVSFETQINQLYPAHLTTGPVMDATAESYEFECALL